MALINVEIKAAPPAHTRSGNILLNHEAEPHGTDEQTDTYFNVAQGRLKLREGKIEGLGSFVEIEASNRFDDIDAEKLKQQCEAYMNDFGVRDEDLIHQSYSDMVAT